MNQTHVVPARLQNLPKTILQKLGTLPERIFARIASQPTQGNGHKELFRDAVAMHEAAFTDSEIESVLRARYVSFYREVPDREYLEAIAGAKLTMPGTRRGRWPLPDLGRIRAITAEREALKRLKESSPTAAPHTLGTTEIIDRIFPSGGLLCFGHSARCPVTQDREWFRGKEAQFQLLVPNPMTKRTGLTKTGRPSVRCASNSSFSRHQVVEFDSGTPADHAAILLHISGLGVPLKMALSSGGKSTHGWFDIEGLDLERFQRYAASLGADTAMFTSSQFARTPNAVRDNSNLQAVYFFQ